MSGNQESGIKNQGAENRIRPAKGSRSAYIPLLMVGAIGACALFFFAIPLVGCNHLCHDVTISAIDPSGNGEYVQVAHRCRNCGGRGTTALFRRLFPAEEAPELIMVGNELVGFVK